MINNQHNLHSTALVLHQRWLAHVGQVATPKLCAQASITLAARRGIDYLFNTNNAVLIASAAKGLRGAREDLASRPFRPNSSGQYGFRPKRRLCLQVELIQLPDFVRFLATPDAEEILSAVFRKCELRYWQGHKRG